MESFKKIIALVVIFSMCCNLSFQVGFAEAQILCPGREEQIKSKEKEIQDKIKELNIVTAKLEGKEKELEVAYWDIAVITDQIVLITAAVATAAALLGAAIEALGVLKASWTAAVKVFQRVWSLTVKLSNQANQLFEKISSLISKIKKNTGSKFFIYKTILLAYLKDKFEDIKKYLQEKVAGSEIAKNIMNKSEQVYKSAKEKIKELKKEYEKKKEELAAWNEKKNNMFSKVIEIKYEINELKEKKIKIQGQIELLRNQLRSIKDSYKERTETKCNGNNVVNILACFFNGSQIWQKTETIQDCNILCMSCSEGSCTAFRCDPFCQFCLGGQCADYPKPASRTGAERCP